MIENPDAYIPIFATFGTPALYLHPETSYHPLRSLQLIRSCGARPGIALDPAMTVHSVRPLLEAGAQILVAGSELEANIERLNKLIGRG